MPLYRVQAHFRCGQSATVTVRAEGEDAARFEAAGRMERSLRRDAKCNGPHDFDVMKTVVLGIVKMPSKKKNSAAKALREHGLRMEVAA